MDKAFRIFKRDLFRLLRNPVALIVTIGVCIIPSLYAWYNIGANWDPYGNTVGVKVAVANEDKGTVTDTTGELNAGNEAEEQLRANHDLGWVFVDSGEEAKAGVERGDYYAAIVIPKDFSENLTSMLTGTFTQPQLVYYVNQKKNAIAPEVTGIGAQTIEAQINETFVGTVSKVVAEKLQAAGKNLNTSLSGAQGRLHDTVVQANDALGEVRGTLSGTQKTVDATKAAVADAQATLGDLHEQVPALTTALDQGDQLLASTRSTTRDFATSLSAALSNGNIALGQASARANAAIGNVSADVVAAAGPVDSALGTAQGATSDIQVVIDALGKIDLPGDNTTLHNLINDLTAKKAELEQTITALQTQSDDIKNTATSVAGLSSTIDDAVQTGIATVSEVQNNFSNNVQPQLSAGLDNFSSVSGDLSGAIASLDPTVMQASGLLKQLNTTLDQAKKVIEQVDSGLATTQNSLSTTASDVEALASSDAFGKLGDALDMDDEDLANLMGSPVELETEAVHPVATYGSGVAPFYTNLAIWVGGFVLIAIFKLEVDTEGIGTITPVQGYFGRWGLMVLLGQLQALIVCIGDLVLGVQNVAPALFVLAGLVASFVYVNIIYALATAFKHIGKAVAVIIVILQIPGASGIYPIEMMPAFFRALYPLLPFTYGINAMRETIGGMYGMHFWQDLGILLLFVVAALFIGLVLRPRMLNLNLLFDRSLSRTDLLICEEHGLANTRFRLSAVVRAMMGNEEYRAELVRRAARFEQRYPQLIRGGFVLVFGLPVLLFALMSVLRLDIGGKIVLLVLWIVAIIVADAYMIAVEYIRENLNEQLGHIDAHAIAAPLGAHAKKGGEQA